MRHHPTSLRTRFTAACALALLTSLLLSGPAEARNPTGPGEPGGEQSNDPRVRARQSLDYLMSTYAVNEDEAMRRLELQARGDDMIKIVRDAVGDELMDVWLDQKGGGKITFVTALPDLARSAIAARFDLAEAAFVKSMFTDAQLRAAEAQVTARMKGYPDAEISIDRSGQQIVVKRLSTDPGAARNVRSQAGIQAGDAVPVLVQTSPPDTSQGEQKSNTCTLLACDPPIRGGLRLHIRRDNGSWGSCTSGFLVRASTGAAFILTAGHCASVPGPKRQFMYHNGLPATVEVNASGAFDDPNAPAHTGYYSNLFPIWDWALLPYQVTGATLWHKYWFTNRSAHNLVLSSCVGGQSPQPCTSGSYGVTGFKNQGDILIGAVVCATGTGHSDLYSQNVGYTPGTRCGVVQDKKMDSYTSSSPTGGALKVNVCSRPGDSGGPLWSQLDGKAYGILSGGPAKTGACNLSDPNDYSVYSTIFNILNDAASPFKTGTTMLLITTPGG